jgi:hypothetical protein
MDDSLSPSDASGDRAISWSLITRVILILAVFGIAGVCVHECGVIIGIEAYWKELLGTKPLPPATQWVIEYRTGFLFAALFTPGAALATFLLRDDGRATGALVVLLLFGGVHALFVHLALKLPSLMILERLSTGP